MITAHSRSFIVNIIDEINTEHEIFLC